MNYQKILHKAEKAVEDFVEEARHPALVFHNIDQVRYVVKSAEKIASYQMLNEEEHFILMLSLWFYDLEPFNIKNVPFSAETFVTDFLNGHEISQDITDRVIALMAAAPPDHAPVDRLEEIMKDAITYFYGKKSCLEYFEDQRKEIELLSQQQIDRDFWLKQVLDILRNHTYYTIFCKQKLDGVKSKNIRAIQKELHPGYEDDGQNAVKAKLTETGKNKSEKAIDAMFRIAESNGQRLSIMADNKAHILITVNSIILSAVISILLRKLDENRNLIIPTILLLAVSLGSMIFSILSTRPSLPRLTLRPIKRQIENINLLFFGNFYHMSLDSYTAEMQKMMNSEEMIYGCLIKDVYTEGRVLAKKYKLLRTSYNIFMFGLIAATLAFIIASVIQPPRINATPVNNTNKVSLHHF